MARRRAAAYGSLRIRGAIRRKALRFSALPRYGALLELGRLAEAQGMLEGCLEVFRRYDDVTMQAKTLSALADLWYQRGDPRQAADLARRALDLTNRLPDPGNRASSHNNLAIYLHRLGETPASARHRLAALCYDLVGGYGDMFRQHANNLALVMAEARAQGEPYPLPTLEALLAQPELEPLRRFLEARGVALPELQDALDQVLESLAEDTAQRE